MIESGSHVPGVDFARYDLPPGTAMRLELPSPELRTLIGNYHAFDSDGTMWDGVINWVMPAGPTIRFALSARNMKVRLGARHYDPVPDAALYGATSRAREVTTHGGVSVGISLTALGWSRLFDASAEEYRDRVVPLDTLLPAAAVRAVTARLNRLDDSMSQLAPILDGFVTSCLRRSSADDAQIVALERLIATNDITDVAKAAQMLDVSPRSLRRVAAQAFGFPPKLLLVRHRFLHALTTMLLQGRPLDYGSLPETYFDRSHFLRDARRFLGTTPMRFAASPDHQFLLARLRAHHALSQTVNSASGVSEAATGRPLTTA